MKTNYFQEHKQNFKQVLQRFVGPYTQPYTVTKLSQITGMTKSSVQSHIDDYGSLPSIPHLIVYFKVFGPDFADGVLAAAGLTVSRADEHEAPTSHEAQLMLAELMKEIIITLEDGHICKKEKAHLSPIARRVGQLLIALANEYDGERE